MPLPILIFDAHHQEFKQTVQDANFPINDVASFSLEEMQQLLNIGYHLTQGSAFLMINGQLWTPEQTFTRDELEKSQNLLWIIPATYYRFLAQPLGEILENGPEDIIEYVEQNFIGFDDAQAAQYWQNLTEINKLKLFAMTNRGNLTLNSILDASNPHLLDGEPVDSPNPDLEDPEEQRSWQPHR